MPLILHPNVKSSQINRNVVADIAVKFDLARPLAEVLYTRGYDSVEKVAEFLSNENNNYKNPFLLSGMTQAINLINKYITEKKDIIVYGDYDVDGICSVAIILMTLKKLGVNVSHYIPDRHNEGYGLNVEVIKKLAAPNTLLITVDCGISSVDEVAFAKQNGMDVIVTDHHNLPEQLPDCIIINPKIESEYGFDQLCGAGVAFKVSQALLGVEEAADFVDLACIATIADIVPLINENKLITKNGLDKINLNPRVGIKELILQSGRKLGEITSSDVSFGIAPRLNAAGRLDSADIALNILLGIDLSENIAKVSFLNARRQELEETVIEQAESIALRSGQIRNRKVIIAGSEDWDKGVIGIAASKLVEKYHRPCLLFSVSNGIATGSGRSIEGVDLYKALSSCADKFIKFGGHAMAAGMSIRIADLDPMADELNNYIESTTPSKCFFPIAKYDARLSLSEISPRLIAQIQQLAPFGYGNAMPKFRVDNLRSTVRRVIGKNGDHLKVSFTDNSTVVESILFSYKDMGVNIINGFNYTVTGYPQINTWNDIQNVNFIVNNIKRDRDYNTINDFTFHDYEILLYSFLKQIMYYDGSDNEECQVIDDYDELLCTIDSFLNDDASGTVVLCNHPEFVRKISQYVFVNHPRCDIDIYQTNNLVNGYNTLLIGSDIKDLNLDAYKNVIICDCYGNSQIKWLNTEFPHLDIYAYFGNKNEYFNISDENDLTFTREVFAKAYLSIKKICSKTDTFDSREALFRNIIGISDVAKFIALDIFEELGFMSYLTVGNTFKLKFDFEAKQNSLENSKIYVNLQQHIPTRK